MLWKKPYLYKKNYNIFELIMIVFNSKMVLKYAHSFKPSVKYLREVLTQLNSNTTISSSNKTDEINKYIGCEIDVV